MTAPNIQLINAAIHRAAGPVWQGGTANEVAFPSISIYRFPVDRASRIALQENPSIEKVLIVVFNDRTFDAYENALREEPL